MKKLFFVIIFCLTASLFGENLLSERQEQNLLNYYIDKGISKSVFVQFSYKGHFISTEKEDILVFLAAPIVKGLDPEIVKTTIVSFNKNDNIISTIDIPYTTGWKKDSFKSEIKGKEIEYGWISDFNANGLDELLFTESYGSYMVWEIFEFQDGKFVKTFDYPYNIKIKSNDFDKKQFTVINHLHSNAKGYYKYVDVTFVWSDKRKKYLIYEPDINNYLPNFFHSELYKLEEYSFANEKFILAYDLQNDNRLIQRGILFRYEDDAMEPLLEIFKSILNPNDTIIDSFYNPEPFYGWKIDIITDTDTLKVYANYNGTQGTNGTMLELKDGVFSKIK